MLLRLNESKEFRINLKYFVLQGLYWMMTCTAVSLGSAYLSNRGYSTAMIGLLYALAFVFAAVLQQIVSVNTDNSSKYNVIDVLAVLGIVTTFNALIAAFSSGKCFATSFTFFMGVLFVTMIHPFLNALNFYIEKHGVAMNYGVSRASGSLFFFLMSLIAGNMIKGISERVLPILCLIISAFFVEVLFSLRVELKKHCGLVDEVYDPFEKKTSYDITYASIKKFVTDNKMFFIILIGIICFYFGHLLINNFIYQITVNVNGDSGDTGGILALAAIVELPAMIFFNQLRDRFGTRILLGTSAVFYFIKILVTALASSVGALYFSMLFQALGFALFIPAAVHFVDEIMDEKDAVKGQAFLTVAMTLGNALASLIGGALISIFGVSASLWFSTIVTLAGVVIAIYGLFRIKVKN